MENPILINARLKVKRAAVTDKNAELEALEKRQNEILRAVEDAKTEDDVDAASTEADDVTKQIADVKSEVQKLQTEIKDIEDKLEDSNADEEPAEEKEEGQRNMATKVITPENTEDAAVRSTIEYINSKGQKRAGITTTDIGAIIPKQVIYDAQDEVETSYDLTNYVEVINVSAPGGTWNVAKNTDESLHSVEELAANPELSHPELITLDWALKTYRGSIQNSNEAVQDATDLKRLLARVLREYVQNTKNRLIVEALKTATPKTVAGIDDLKHIKDVDLDPQYDLVLVLSQSAYHYLDTLKDNDGRYLLQPDITAASGKSLFGSVPVQVVKDNLIGTKAGDMVGFFGDSRRFVKFFDRDEVQIGWATNENFAQNMLAAIRANVKTADTAAGFYVTFTPSTGAQG